MAEEILKFDELDMTAFAELEIPEEVETPEEEKPLAQENKVITEEETPEVVGDEEDDDEQETPEEGKGSSSQSNLYSSLASALIEEGVLPSLSEDAKIESVDDLINAFKNEIKANEFADLTDAQKEYLQGIRNGIPEQAIKQHLNIKDQLNSISKEELEKNSELRKQLIIQDFITKGYDQAKAEKFAERSITVGEDLDDALVSLESLKEAQSKAYQLEVQKAEAVRLQKEQENAKQVEDFKKSIFETKEVIPGVKINNQIAQKVYEQAMTPVSKAPNGAPINAIMKARLDDPIGFETKLNYIFYLTKGFSDFSKIEKTQKSKAIRELDEVIKGDTFKIKETGANKQVSAFSPDIINNIK